MSENAFTWAGVLSMMFLSVVMMVIAIPVVSDWQDEWREYAKETSFGGPCAEDPTLPQCQERGYLERWQLVPWLLTFGFAASLLALCLPVDYELRRSDGGGGGARRAWNFLREQR